MDRYGYIGIETLLKFCENCKDHAVTPNGFMRMQWEKRPRGRWHIENNSLVVLDVCDRCMRSVRHVAPFYDFCPHCGTDMREEEHDE